MATSRHIVFVHQAQAFPSQGVQGTAERFEKLLMCPVGPADTCHFSRRDFNCACQVWASKWNDRAWLSRRARGVPDDALYMAALIQQVHDDIILHYASLS